MENYKMSEPAKRYIRIISLRQNAVLMVSILVALCLVVFFASDYIRKYGVFLTIVFLCFYAYIITVVIALLAQLIFPLGTDVILRKNCNPFLALEVNHAIARKNRKEKFLITCQINTGVCYYYQGKYNEALISVSDQYLDKTRMNQMQQVQYLQLLFACYIGKRNYADALEVYEKLRHTLENVSERKYKKISDVLENDYFEYESVWFETIQKRQLRQEYKEILIGILEENISCLEKAVYSFSLAKIFWIEEDFKSAEIYFRQVIENGNQLYIVRKAKQFLNIMIQWNSKIVRLDENRMEYAVSFLKKMGKSNEKDILERNIVYLYQENLCVKGIIIADPVTRKILDVVREEGISGELIEKELSEQFLNTF